MRYGDVTAVDGLSVDVHLGEVTAVVGPNGAGKTTTLETCEGYRRPQHGTVRVLGLDPIADAAQLRPRVGVMLQSGGAWPGVRAAEALRHAASLHAHPLDVDALVERLGLGACGSTPYRRLSGGQQQRLGLAMAVIGRPELVVLDEPTAGLDPQGRRSVWDLVAEMRAAGVTVVLSTHYLDEAEQLADRVVVIDHGQVIASGSPAELSARGSENTMRFAARPGLDVHHLRAALPLGSQVEELTPGAYVVRGAVDPALIATLTAWCAAQGVLAQSLSVEHRTLEDVFLDLTGRSASR
jgi:ABC-2 type transport system ATP-binding protein